MNQQIKQLAICELKKDNIVTRYYKSNAEKKCCF